MNTQTKLFELIYKDCLLGLRKKWAASMSVGIRGRGCDDNIFILNPVVQIHLRLKGGKFWDAFIDFKRVFDTVNS